MCLGIPGRVIDIVEQNGILMGRVDISRLDEAAAEETLALLRAIEDQAAAEDEPQP